MKINFVNLTHFAATYNCGAYGTGTYNEQGECVTTTDGGKLVNTGTEVYLYAGAGLALIIVGIVLLTRLFKKKK